MIFWDIPAIAKEFRDNVNEAKATTPFIFPEYVNMINAKRKLDIAQLEYDNAVKEWEAC